MKKHELKAIADTAQRHALRYADMYERAQEKNEELQRINSELNAQLREARLKLTQYGGVPDNITFTTWPQSDEADPLERLTND